MPTGLSVSRAAALVVAVCALSSPSLANNPLPIDLGGPLQLFIDSSPPLLDTQTCTPINFHIVENSGTSGGFLVQLRAVPSNVPVSFYDTNDCAGSAVTGIATTGSTGTFYVRPTNDEYRFASIRASVTAGSSTAHGVLPVQVGDSRPQVMSLIGDNAVSANSCSGLMAVTFKDVNGFPMMGISGVGTPSVSLTAQTGSGISFYSDAHCTQPISQLTVLGDSATFSFLAPTQGSFFIKAAVNLTGVAEASRTISVGPASTAAGRISFISAPQIIPARSDAQQLKSCSAPFVIEGQDAQGGSMTAPGEAVVTLSAASGGSSTSAVSFFSDADCSVPFSATNPLRFTTGQGHVVFYANAAKAGTFGVIATASTGFANGSAAQVLEVAPGAANQLYFLKEPSTFIHGRPQAMPVKIYLSDADGNATVSESPITVALDQNEASITAGTVSHAYDPGTRYAAWMDLELKSNASSGWGRMSLTMTASTSSPARQFTQKSSPFVLLENSLDVVAQLSPSQPKKCEAVTVALSVNGATTQSSNDVYSVCVDDQSSATFETYEGFTLVSTSGGHCLTGTLPSTRTVTLKNTTAEQSFLNITNQTLRLPTQRVTLDWAETGVDCGGGAPQTVALTVTLDTQKPMLGSSVLLDIRARDLNGGPADANAIRIVGDSLRIEAVVDTLGVTLFAPDELRFADQVPDTIRVRAVVTGSGTVTAIALDDNAQTIGQSEALQLELETPTEAATFGCSTTSNSFALAATMLVFAWFVFRRQPKPVAIARAKRGHK